HRPDQVVVSPSTYSHSHAPRPLLSSPTRRSSDLALHDLRHTSATLLIAQNVHAKIISERLGHKKISTTMDTYGHALPSVDKEARDRKSTRLNSSHVSISYAVFCSKKKYIASS